MSCQKTDPNQPEKITAERICEIAKQVSSACTGTHHEIPDQFATIVFRAALAAELTENANIILDHVS